MQQNQTKIDKLEFKDPQNQVKSITSLCNDLKKSMEKYLYVKLNKQCPIYFENLIQEQLNFYINKVENAKNKQSVKKPTCRDLLKVLNEVQKKQNSPIEVTFTRKEIVTLTLMMYLDLIQYQEEKNFLHFSQFHRFVSYIAEFKHLCIQYYLMQSFFDLQDDDAELIKFKQQSFELPKNYKSQQIEMSKYQTYHFLKEEPLNMDTMVFINSQENKQDPLSDPSDDEIFYKEGKFYQYPESLVKLLFIKKKEEEVILISNLIKFNDFKKDNNNHVSHKKLNADQINNMLTIDAIRSTQKLVDENQLLKCFGKFYSAFKLAAEYPKSQIWISDDWIFIPSIDFLIQIWALSLSNQEIKKVNKVSFNSSADNFVKQFGITKDTKLSHQFVLDCLQKINSEKN